MRKIVLLFLCVFASGCSTYKANTGSGAEERKTQQITIDAPYDEVYTIAIRMAAKNEWKVIHSDKDGGIIQVETPGSMKVWDDDVSITILNKGEETVVSVRSGLANSPNVSNVTKYLNDIKSNF